MSSILNSLPPTFAANVRNVFGDRGDAWLADLDNILADCADRWAITIGRPFEGGFVNFVAEARLPNGAGASLPSSPKSPTSTAHASRLGR